MVASPDFATLDRICSALSSQPDFQLVCTSRLPCEANNCATNEFDLLILDIDDVTDFSSLIGSVLDAKRAIVWVCGEKNLARFVRAASSADLAISTDHLVFKPMIMEELPDSVQRSMRANEQTTLLAEKYLKMRQLVRRVVRERRDINRRVELVCRDLVEAHRRLTYRFVQMQHSNK